MHPSSDTDLGRYYDAAPYRSYAYPESAPEHLAALAHVLGQPAASTSTARVLELGCASGGNLVPFALRNAASESVGIDLSTEQIRVGRALVDRMGLRNIELIAEDFAALDQRSLGQFDYVICHGVYSWIPREAQGPLLALCRSVLSPHGLVYVSYNTYPGWKSKEVIRDAMLLHCADRTVAADRTAYAKAMLGFLKKTVAGGTLLSQMVEESIQLIRRTGDDYLAHDYLEPHNNPCYFRDFVRNANQNGLQYLAESGIRRMRPRSYGRAIAEPLMATFAGDQVKMEQYLDFTINRSFRQTVLAHASSGPVDHQIRRERLRDIHFAAQLPPRSGPTKNDGSFQHYGRPDREPVSTADTSVKRMADALNACWPNTHTLDSLTASVLQDTGAAVPDPQLRRTAEHFVEHLIEAGLCHIRMQRVKGCSAPDAPCLSPEVRRFLAALDEDRTTVPNVWHESVDLSPEDLATYPLMDGKRSIQEICRELRETRPLDEASKRAADSIEAIVKKAAETGLLCVSERT